MKSTKTALHFLASFTIQQSSNSKQHTSNGTGATHHIILLILKPNQTEPNNTPESQKEVYPLHHYVYTALNKWWVSLVPHTYIQLNGGLIKESSNYNGLEKQSTSNNSRKSQKKRILCLPKAPPPALDEEMIWAERKKK